MRVSAVIKRKIAKYLDIMEKTGYITQFNHFNHFDAHIQPKHQPILHKI